LSADAYAAAVEAFHDAAFHKRRALEGYQRARIKHPAKLVRAALVFERAVEQLARAQVQQATETPR